MVLAVVSLLALSYAPYLRPPSPFASSPTKTTVMLGGGHAWTAVERGRLAAAERSRQAAIERGRLSAMKRGRKAAVERGRLAAAERGRQAAIERGRLASRHEMGARMPARRVRVAEVKQW